MRNPYTTTFFVIDQICGDYLAEDDTEDDESLEISGSKLQGYLGNLSHSCEEMFLRCSFEGNLYNCSELFKPIVTDEGQCCTFNTQPPSVMFKNVEPEVLKKAKIFL